MKKQPSANDKSTEQSDDPDEIGELEYRIRRRPQAAITVRLPEDVLASLEEIAEDKSTSLEALIRLYVANGLREDIAQLYSHRVLDRVARVLARHIDSPEEVESIVHELREAAGGPAVRWARDSK